MYIEVKGQWMYLYHVVNSEGHTISFYLRKLRDKVAKSFFKLITVILVCYMKNISLRKYLRF
ncbi:DDE-type integrase/transposase/recombinase [Priestia aryabhattai]|uniref:DDE-type integrase/transposase/recombinase n=1 Tax=Priestia aryabhattai TaxID=412384 RepID=UPI0035CD3CC7